jgi:hypothetical protein
MVTTPWPRFAGGGAIPPPLNFAYFIVLPHGGFADDTDCFLGQIWFAKRTWTFDYQQKRYGGARPAIYRRTSGH